MNRIVCCGLLLIHILTLSSCNPNYASSTPSVAAVPSGALAIQAPTVTSAFTATLNTMSMTQPVTPTFTNTVSPQPQTATLPNFVIGSTIQHNVVKGEWMMQIARCYGADFNGIRKANPQIVDPNIISANRILTVPNIGSNGLIYGPPCVGYHTVRAGDTWNSIAQTYNADVSILQAANRGVLSLERVLKVPLNSAGGTILSPTSTSPTLALSTPVESPTTSVTTTASPATSVVPSATSENSTSTPARATSDQLIDQALARHELDSETALIYKVYAAYGDHRLPTAYQGDDSEIEENNIMWDVGAVFNTLSPSTQALMRPFFIPPAYSGSWADQTQASFRQFEPDLFHITSFQAITPTHTPAPVPSPLPKDNWLTLETNSHVKIWWQKGSGNESAALEVLAIADKVWLKLVPLMGREPLDDTGWAGDGGDKRLDIYLYPIPGASRRAQTVTFGGCAEIPVWMQVDPDPVKRLGTPFETIFVHEFMHAIQYSFDLKDNNCEEYRWLMEATARWAEDYADWKANHEQNSAPKFLKDPNLSLNFPSLQHSYGAYLFFFYLAGKDRANASLIRQIFFNAQLEDSLTAIENAIQGRGGFKEVWPDFVLNNWNRIPVANYKAADWDGLPHGALSSPTDASFETLEGDVTNVDLAGAPGHQYQLDMRVNPLAAKYFRFIFSDPNVRSVSFENPFFYSNSTDENPASVWALVKYANHNWEKQDWSDKAHKNFCRDDPDERLEELVIIVSNSEWQDLFHELEPYTDKLLSVNNIACNGWSGSFSYSTHGVNQSPGGIYVENTSVIKIGDVTFTPYTGKDNDDSLSLNYHLLESKPIKLNWSVNGVLRYPDGDNCTYEGNRSMDFTPTNSPNTPGTAHGVLTTPNFVGSGDRIVYGSIDLTFDPNQKLTIIWTCTHDDGKTETYPTDLIREALSLELDQATVKDDGIISGENNTGSFKPLPPK
jgi:LysM repeat protein